MYQYKCECCKKPVYETLQESIDTWNDLVRDDFFSFIFNTYICTECLNEWQEKTKTLWDKFFDEKTPEVVNEMD